MFIWVSSGEIEVNLDKICTKIKVILCILNATQTILTRTLLYLPNRSHFRQFLGANPFLCKANQGNDFQIVWALNPKI